MSEVIQKRQIRFYLWPDWLFKLSAYWPEQCKNLGKFFYFYNMKFNSKLTFL